MHAKEIFKMYRAEHRKEKRKEIAAFENKKNERLNTILTKDPRKLYQSIKQSKSQSSAKINELKVGSTVYAGDSVADGFYHSLSGLKTVDANLLNSDLTFQQF